MDAVNEIPAAAASIDSRTLRPGEVYYALAGEHRDGHDFVEAALAAGAAAAVVAEAQAHRYPAALQAQLRVVANPLQALQADAQRRRRAWGGPLVAITGSAGKTTTKEMAAAVLATRLRVLKSEGNYNNHLGLPLTLLRLRPENQIAVVEMGMNHAGEIAALAALAHPNVGVFTNVGSAHLGNFGSIEGIAEAKRELARAIPSSGALVLNRDDARVAAFGEGFAGRVLFYRAQDFPSPLLYPGAHNRANAAAAAAVGSLFGVPYAEAAAALTALEPPAGRGQILQHHGMTFIHDCYNANPEAMAQMLEVLASTPAQRRIAVLGDMRELGDASARLHRELGARVAAAAVDALFTVGAEAALMAEAARAAGFAGTIEVCPDAGAAAARLQPFLRPGDAVLFKASRALHLEQAVLALAT